MVTSRNPKVVMDSVCAAKRNEDVYKVMKSVDKTSQSLSKIDLSKELYLNVIAISGDG